MDCYGPSKSRGDGDHEGRPLATVRSWCIAFCQDCNMRCTYCHTRHGTLGHQACVMKPSVWEPLGRLIIESARPDCGVRIAFGCGETFLCFDEFMRFVEYLERLADVRGVPLSLQVSTNGLLLNEERCALCARHRISLSFSIDGPAHIHDGARRDRNGLPTHQRVMANWRTYRALSLKLTDPPTCNVLSVIHDESRLLDVAEYWRQEGVPIFDAVVQEPRPGHEKGAYENWQARRDRYLEDFETVAMAEAKRLSIPEFLSDYAGPSVLLFHWKDLFLETHGTGCGVGVYELAVDAHGNIYPCEGFIGYPQWVVGTVSSGLDTHLLLDLRRRRNELLVECQSCEANVLCAKGCCAASPDKGLVLNSEGGCLFSRRLVDISLRSYEVLKKKS